MSLENKNRIHKLLLYSCLLCVIALGLISIVASGPTTQQVRKKSPGLYNIKGWNYDKACHYGTCGIDINGKVGYSLFVNGPRARCEPSRKWSTSDERIISGTLPPGLAFQKGSSHIKGIPKKRGHWIVRIKVDHLYCGGKRYSGFEQELRFHITGSGRVNQ